MWPKDKAAGEGEGEERGEEGMGRERGWGMLYLGTEGTGVTRVLVSATVKESVLSATVKEVSHMQNEGNFQ